MVHTYRLPIDSSMPAGMRCRRSAHSYGLGSAMPIYLDLDVRCLDHLGPGLEFDIDLFDEFRRAAGDGLSPHAARAHSTRAITRAGLPSAPFSFMGSATST